MPDLDSNDQSQQHLIDLFNSLQLTSSAKAKADLLFKAEVYVVNQMTKEQLIDFFVSNKSNFENLFLLDIWTSDLEKSNGNVEFTEPYEIIEKLFNSFDTFDSFIKIFNSQITFLLMQEKDEKIKHICVKNLIRLAKAIDLNDTETLSNLKVLMPIFIRQIPKTTVKYTQLLSQLFCFLTNIIDNQMVVTDNNGESTDENVRHFKKTIFENNPNLTNEMENVAKLNSVNSFRIFEIIIQLACCSKEHLINLCEEEFKLNEKILCHLNNTNDILSQLNCIELLFNLAKTQHGFEYMDKMGYLHRFISILHEKEDSMSASFLIPSVVKLFSHLARIKYGTFNYPDYFNFLFKQVFADDIDLNKNSIYLNLTIQTFSYLFELNYVIEKIYKNYEKEMLKLVNKLAWIVKNIIKNEIKANALICIAELLAIDPSLLQTDQTDLKWAKVKDSLENYSKLGQIFYQHIGSEQCSHEKFFEICLNLAKHPFVETRLAAQYYFKALSQSKWGIIELFTPNKYNNQEVFFTGYILNRSTELEKAGLESKYELVKQIHAFFQYNHGMVDLIGDMNWHKLKFYMQEGPFFTKVESRVAMEST